MYMSIPNGEVLVVIVVILVYTLINILLLNLSRHACHFRYLQWLIEDQDCFDTQLHTLYALSLAKSAIEAFEFEVISENIASANTERENLPTLRNSIFQTPVRERLQIFLQSSDLYDPEEVLDLIEGSELWLEKVIISPLTNLSNFYFIF